MKLLSRKTCPHFDRQLCQCDSFPLCQCFPFKFESFQRGKTSETTFRVSNHGKLKHSIMVKVYINKSGQSVLSISDMMEVDYLLTVLTVHHNKSNKRLPKQNCDLVSPNFYVICLILLQIYYSYDSCLFWGLFFCLEWALTRRSSYTLTTLNTCLPLKCEDAEDVAKQCIKMSIFMTLKVTISMRFFRIRGGNCVTVLLCV